MSIGSGMAEDKTWNVEIANSSIVDTTNSTTPEVGKILEMEYAGQKSISSSSSPPKSRCAELLSPFDKIFLCEILWISFWMSVSYLFGAFGWINALDTFKCGNSLKIRIYMFVMPVSLLAPIIGLKLSWRTIGCYAKCVVYFFSVCAVVLVEHFQPTHNKADSINVTFITIQLHAVSQLLRCTRDIYISDILLGAIMQVAVYMTARLNVYAFAAVLATCGGAIIYKFFSYSLPPLGVPMT